MKPKQYSKLKKQLASALAYNLLFYLVFVVFSTFLIDYYTSAALAVFAVLLAYVKRNPEKLDWLLKDLSRMSAFKNKEMRSIDSFMYALVVLYAILLTVHIARNHFAIMPDQMIFYGLVGAFILGRSKSFLLDWIPFVLLLSAYEAMRGLIYVYGESVFYSEVIWVEQTLFGSIPTVAMQQATHIPGVISIADAYFSFVYCLHYLVPLMFAYLLWLKSRDDFKHFSATMVLLSYAALVTFLLIPVAPPWLAAEQGFIPQIQHIIFDVAGNMGVTYFPTLYGLMNANPVAAVPSLHSAYPLLILFFAYSVWGKKGLVTAVYPISIWVGVVYTGEHYLIDVFIGIAYAVLAFFFVQWWFARDN